MSSNYEIIESILNLDINAALVSNDFRKAKQELEELNKKTQKSQNIISRSRSDMTFNEAEARRIYKKLDILDEKRADKTSKLSGSKTDDDHKLHKREVDNIDRDTKENQKTLEIIEERVESNKQILKSAEKELDEILKASAEELKKAKEAEDKSMSKLNEMKVVRENYMKQLDDILMQHYKKVAKITHNPSGPINRVVNNACGNCHIGLSPQMLIKFAKDKIYDICPNCSHILIT